MVKSEIEPPSSEAAQLGMLAAGSKEQGNATTIQGFLDTHE